MHLFRSNVKYPKNEKLLHHLRLLHIYYFTHYLFHFTAKTVLNPDRLYRRQNLSNGAAIHHAEGHDQRHNASPWLHGSLPRSGCLAQVLLLGGRYQIIFVLGQIKFARDFRLVKDNSFDMETWIRFWVSFDVLSDMGSQFLYRNSCSVNYTYRSCVNLEL